MSTDLAQLERYYGAAPVPNASAEEVGPFTLFVANPDVTHPYYARPRLGRPGRITTQDVDDVRARQRARGVPESLEWVHQTTPELLEAAPASGLHVQEWPSLVLAKLSPVDVGPQIEIRMLGADDPGFDTVRATVHGGFADRDEVAVSADPRRRELVREHLMALAGAWLDGSPVGAGRTTLAAGRPR